MNQRTVCILGGTGYVGTHLVNALASLGYSLRVLTRRRERHRSLLVLPTVEVHQANVHDQSVLERYFEDCDMVINLVGILNEKHDDGKGFYYAHVELARKVIAACKKKGVRRLLHMSALNAQPTASSHYLRTKGEAENYVHTFSANSIITTSFRPSVIFGAGDSFITRFAKLLKMTPFVFPLACPNAKFAPVYVGDVVQVMVNAVNDVNMYGKRIDLCGPQIYTLREIVRLTAQIFGYHRVVIGLPQWLSKLQAAVLEYVPGKPFSLDNYRSLQTDSVCHNTTPCPTSLESMSYIYTTRNFPGDSYDHYRKKFFTD